MTDCTDKRRKISSTHDLFFMSLGGRHIVHFEKTVLYMYITLCIILRTASRFVRRDEEQEEQDEEEDE